MLAMAPLPENDVKIHFIIVVARNAQKYYFYLSGFFFVYIATSTETY